MDALTIRNRSEIPVLDSVSGLAPRFDVWLCDIWGVMHNGVNGFAGAIRACQEHRRAGGVVVLISNAPRPNRAVAAQIAGFGVPSDSYDGIVTSGDVTRALLESAGEGGGPYRKAFHLGPERDLPIFEGLEVERVEPAEAEVVVCSGLYDDETETPADYAALFEQLMERRLPMICANPDVVVGRGDQLVYCAGALARAYEELGGEVAYAGKPYGPIYDLALETAGRKRGGVRRERVLAIGDGLETDLAGAVGMGFAALFVAGGMHRKEFGPAVTPAAVMEFFEASEERRRSRPLAVIGELAW
jgi:HAD superfamily hydrolase (TIGR01459 family)